MSYASEKSCAPARAKCFDGTCYSFDALKEIAKAYNEKNPNNPIDIDVNDKKQLWKAIRAKIGSKCQTEWCWIEQDFVENIKKKRDEVLTETFRPMIPEGKYEWLSNSDIDFVLHQYTLMDPTFRYFSAAPIDFQDANVSGFRNLSLKSDMEQRGIRKWGFVFNTDKSSGSGEHWVGMYVELFHTPNQMKWGTIDYFDSYGKEPPDEIKQLMHRLVTQGQKAGYNMVVNVNRRRHQFKNSECGVYVINFIVNRLLGVPFSEVTRNVVHDEKMNELRKKYFRGKN